MEQDNIETTIENGKINLREINGEKHQGFKHPPNILSFELGLFLTQFGREPTPLMGRKNNKVLKQCVKQIEYE